MKKTLIVLISCYAVCNTYAADNQPESSASYALLASQQEEQKLFLGFLYQIPEKLAANLIAQDSLEQLVKNYQEDSQYTGNIFLFQEGFKNRFLEFTNIMQSSLPQEAAVRVTALAKMSALDIFHKFVMSDLLCSAVDPSSHAEMKRRIKNLPNLPQLIKTDQQELQIILSAICSLEKAYQFHQKHHLPFVSLQQIDNVDTQRQEEKAIARRKKIFEICQQILLDKAKNSPQKNTSSDFNKINSLSQQLYSDNDVDYTTIETIPFNIDPQAHAELFNVYIETMHQTLQEAVHGHKTEKKAVLVFVHKNTITIKGNI